MTREEIDEVKALAKDRGQVLLFIRVDGRFCQQARGTFEFIGPVSDGSAAEVTALLKRLVEEGRV